MPKPNLQPLVPTNRVLNGAVAERLAVRGGDLPQHPRHATSIIYSRGPTPEVNRDDKSITESEESESETEESEESESETEESEESESETEEMEFKAKFKETTKVNQVAPETLLESICLDDNSSRRPVSNGPSSLGRKDSSVMSESTAVSDALLLKNAQLADENKRLKSMLAEAETSQSRAAGISLSLPARAKRDDSKSKSKPASVYSESVNISDDESSDIAPAGPISYYESDEYDGEIKSREYEIQMPPSPIPPEQVRTLQEADVALQDAETIMKQIEEDTSIPAWQQEAEADAKHEINMASAMFHAMDKNKNGSLSHSELKRELQGQRWAQPLLQEEDFHWKDLFEKYQGGDGVVNEAEFIHLYSDLLHPLLTAQVLESTTTLQATQPLKQIESEKTIMLKNRFADARDASFSRGRSISPTPGSKPDESDAEIAVMNVEITKLYEQVTQRNQIAKAIGVLNAVPQKKAVSVTFSETRLRFQEDKQAAETAAAQIAALEAEAEAVAVETAALKAFEEEQAAAAHAARMVAEEAAEEARLAEADAMLEREKNLEEVREEVEAWAEGIFIASKGDVVKGLPALSGFGSLSSVFGEDEFAQAIEIVFSYHCRHNISNQILTPSQFIHLAKEAGFNEDFDEERLCETASLWPSRASHDAIYLYCLGKRFSHGDMVDFNSFLRALIKLSGTSRINDWTEEAIARDELRRLLRKRVVPLARFILEEPVELADHMEQTAMGLLEEHWELLQAIFYQYGQPLNEAMDKKSRYISVEALGVSIEEVERIYLDFGFSEVGISKKALKEAVQTVSGGVQKDETLLRWEQFVHLFTHLGAEFGKENSQLRAYLRLGEFLSYLTDHSKADVAFTTWKNRIRGCYPQLVGVIGGENLEAFTQIWRFYSIHRASDRCNHVYEFQVHPDGKRSQLANPLKGPVAPRRADRTYLSLRADSNDQLDGVMDLTNFKAFIKACRVPKHVISSGEVADIAYDTAPKSTEMLGFDHFLFALLHVSRIVSGWTNTRDASSAISCFNRFINCYVLPNAQRLDPNDPTFKDHPRMSAIGDQDATPARPNLPPSSWERLSRTAVQTLKEHQNAYGIGIDEIITHQVHSTADGLSAAQMYAIVEDAGIKAAAEGDIEALILDHDGSSGEPFECSRRDFVRLLVRTAERIDLEQAPVRAPNPEGTLWTMLSTLIDVVRVLTRDPLGDRLEQQPRYALMLEDWA